MSRSADDGDIPPDADASLRLTDDPFALRLDVEPLGESNSGAACTSTRTIYVQRAHGLAERVSPLTSVRVSRPSSTAVPLAAPSPAGPARSAPASTAGVLGQPAAMHRILLEEALVVPAGSRLQGRIRARALLLHGEIVGTVHCGRGPAVILQGASIKGHLVADGDVHVCGSVIDYAGGTVITARGSVVLAPGARVEGDVCSGRIEIHEGATLNGAARGFHR